MLMITRITIPGSFMLASCQGYHNTEVYVDDHQNNNTWKLYVGQLSGISQNKSICCWSADRTGPRLTFPGSSILNICKGYDKAVLYNMHYWSADSSCPVLRLPGSSILNSCQGYHKTEVYVIEQLIQPVQDKPDYKQPF